MRISSVYLLVAVTAFLFGGATLFTGIFSIASMFWVVAIIFFVVYLGFRIVEMLSDIERRSFKSYEELEEIFMKKYGKKPRPGRKKGSSDTKPRKTRSDKGKKKIKK